MAKKKKAIRVLSTLIMVYILSFVIANTDTTAWFVSETKADGKIVNATTKDLLLITPSVISYDTNCVTNIKLDIKNISKMEIPIQLEDMKEKLSPGETFSETFTEKVSCQSKEQIFYLTGLNHYIDESISVTLKPNLLVETAKPKQSYDERRNEQNDVRTDDTKLDQGKTSDDDKMDDKLAETEIENDTITNQVSESDEKLSN